MKGWVFFCLPGHIFKIVDVSGLLLLPLLPTLSDLLLRELSAAVRPLLGLLALLTLPAAGVSHIRGRNENVNVWK